MTKTLAIVTNQSWSTYNFRLTLAHALRDNGYRVILIAPRDDYSPYLEKEFPYHHITLDNKGTNPIRDLWALINFFRLYRQCRPDIVLQFTIKPNIYGSLAARFLKIKTINNITGLGTLFIKETWATKIAKILYKVAFARVDKVFFQNTEDKDFFLKNRLVTNSVVDILPGSGVDTKKFFPMKKSQVKPFTFLLIARILWDKGINEYIEAIKILQKKYSAKFLLLGALGDDKTAIPHRTIQKWEEKGYITYLGISDNMPEMIAQSDCVVLPSYREGTSRSLLEAASMAKPIITTDSVGCRNVVEDGITGFLCQKQDPQDLAKKMEQLLKLSPQKRQEMGKQGRRKILREFDEKIVIQKYLQTINSLLL